MAMKSLVVGCSLLFAWASLSHADIVLVGGGYSQDFDGIGSGLPTGVSVRVNANASSLGAPASFQSAKQTWNASDAGFHNFAANDSLSLSADATQQDASSDRALGVHVVNSESAIFSPGSAFTFRFENTVGVTRFDLTFQSQLLLDADPGLPNLWTVRWGAGENPTSFTNVATFNHTQLGSVTRAYTLADGFANSTDVRWLQIVTLESGTTSKKSGHSFGIDDIRLTSVPEPGSILLALAGCGLIGVRFRASRRSASCEPPRVDPH